MVESKSSIFSAIKVSFTELLQTQYPYSVIQQNGQGHRYYIGMEQGYTFWAYISLTNPRVEIRDIESTTLSDIAKQVRYDVEKLLRESVGRYS